jgi:hypothetical protein
MSCFFSLTVSDHSTVRRSLGLGVFFLVAVAWVMEVCLVSGLIAGRSETGGQTFMRQSLKESCVPPCMNLKFVQGSRLFSRVLSFSAHDTPNETQQKQTNPNNKHN